MANPGAHVEINAYDMTRQAWESAKANAKGFKDTMAGVNAVLGGLGAGAVVGKIYDIGRAFAESALGIGDWILEAERAGATIDRDLIERSERLNQEVKKAEASFYSLGAAMVGPFLSDIEATVAGVRALADQGLAPLRRFIEGARVFMETKEALLSGDFGALKAALAGAGTLAFETQLGELTPQGREPTGTFASDGGDEFSEGDFDMAEKDQEKKDAQRRREAEHRAKLTADTALWYDQMDFQESEREARKIEKEQIHAAQVMEQLAVTRAERFAAIDSWEQREIAMVGANEAAKERIHREAGKRRTEDDKKEKKERLDRERQNLTMGVQLLGAAFGQSKGIRIAEALVNTYTGVTAALARGPAGIAPAALILAQGIKQVQSIKSTNPGSGGFGGGATGGSEGISVGGPPAGFGGEPDSAIQAKAKTDRGRIELHFVGNVMTPEFVRETMIPELKKASLDGYDMAVFDERGRPRMRGA